MSSIAIAGASGVTIGTTPIIGGTDTCVLFDKAGVVGEDTGLEFDYTNKALKLVGSATISQPILNAAQTWNDGGAGTTVFTGLKFNATDTSSAATSLLLDLQKGSNSQLKVDKFGNVTTADSSSSKHLFGNNDLGAVFNFNSNTSSLNPGAAFRFPSIVNGGTALNIITGGGVGTIVGIACMGTPTSQMQFLCYNQTSNGQASFQVQALGSTGQLFTHYTALSNPSDWSTGLYGTTGEYRISNAADLTTPVFGISSAKSVMTQMQGALATNATDGFLYIPTCAGAPTGVPTAHAGMVALVYDTTDNKLYIYNGGWQGGVVPGVWS